MFSLINLPFNPKDYERYLSLNTINIHYQKHHQAYINKTNELIKDTEFKNHSLEEIIQATFNKENYQILYNNAGQVYNHNIYWQSFGIWNRLEESEKEKILHQFGSKEKLIEKLKFAAISVFGSGWTWLVKDKENTYQILNTKNGDTPIPLESTPIFNIDVWEHAYYLDYQNLRPKYVENFITGILKI